MRAFWVLAIAPLVAEAFLPSAVPAWGASRASLSLRPSSLRTPSRSALRMSDLSDMTIEMLKRLERNMDDLDEIELARVAGMCTQLADKANKQRGASAAPAADGRQKTAEEIEAENDEFFGISKSSAQELEDISTPSVRTVEVPKASETLTPPKAAKVETAKEVGTAAGQRFSKYIDQVRPKDPDFTPATDESLISDEEWNAYYKERFGVDPTKLAPLIDEDIPRPLPKEGEKDEFAPVRMVQANANSYESPDAYYTALNAAIADWQKKRKTAGDGLIGAIVSDRYMDQLSSMQPFDEAPEGQKFSLGCMLVEEKGEDADGNSVQILVLTSIDRAGTLSPLGLEKGDALLAINGNEVHSYKDLKRELDKIHKKEELSAEITVQKNAENKVETVMVTSSL